MMEAGRALRILGAGGHACVAADAWEAGGGRILAFHDDHREVGGDSQVAGPISAALSTADPLHIAIGDNEARARIADGADDSRFPPVLHPSAIRSRSAAVAAGALICAGVILQPRCTIGRHTIINTAALVEHDCDLGDFVHVAPGVRLAGNVRIGDKAFIGLGAVVIPGISIGPGAVVGAGAVVIRDVPGAALVAGNPARTIR